MDNQGTLGIYCAFSFECSKIDIETAKAIGVVINSSGTEVLGIADWDRATETMRFPCIPTEDGLRAQFYAFAYDPQTKATTGTAQRSIRVE